MPDRIQEEIEDLLSRLDTFPPPKPWHQRLRETISRTIGQIFAPLGRFRFNPGYVVLGAIFVAVAAYFMYDSLGGFAGLIIIGAVVAFIVAFVMSLRRNTRPPTKYWRDRPMDLNKPGPDWRSRRRR